MSYRPTRLPRSVACRPFAIEIAVYEARKHGPPTTGTFRMPETHHTVAVTLDAPTGGHRLRVGAKTLTLAGVGSRPVTVAVP